VTKKPCRAERSTNFSKNAATAKGQITSKKTQAAVKNAENENPKRYCNPEKKTIKSDQPLQQVNVNNRGAKTVSGAISPKSMLRYESCGEDSLLSPELQQESERKQRDVLAHGCQGP